MIFIRIFYKLTSQQRCRKANIQKVMLLTPHKIYDRQHQQVPHKPSEDICHQVLMVDTKLVRLKEVENQVEELAVVVEAVAVEA